MRIVHLRAEQDGEDNRFLDAHLRDDGSLVVEGQDLGPGTAMASGDGEYEYGYVFDPDSIPLLRQALGGDDGEEILDLLERRFTGRNSYELERIITDTRRTIPCSFWNWSG